MDTALKKHRDERDKLAEELAREQYKAAKYYNALRLMASAASMHIEAIMKLT